MRSLFVLILCSDFVFLVQLLLYSRHFLPSSNFHRRFDLINVLVTNCTTNCVAIFFFARFTSLLYSILLLANIAFETSLHAVFCVLSVLYTWNLSECLMLAILHTVWEIEFYRSKMQIYWRSVSKFKPNRQNTNNLLLFSDKVSFSNVRCTLVALVLVLITFWSNRFHFIENEAKKIAYWSNQLW